MVVGVAGMELLVVGSAATVAVMAVVVSGSGMITTGMLSESACVSVRVRVRESQRCQLARSVAKKLEIWHI